MLKKTWICENFYSRDTPLDSVRMHSDGSTAVASQASAFPKAPVRGSSGKVIFTMAVLGYMDKWISIPALRSSGVAQQ